VCRGDGVVRDAAGRDEVCACTNHPPRDPYAPASAGWAGDALGEIMRKAERRRAEAEAHAASCNDRPCKRCERFICACGKPFDGAQNHRCRDCWKAEKIADLIGPFRDGIPKRFRWAFDATAATMKPRVKASDELIARALANPPSGDLTLFGDTAMGKTSLAVAMLDAWVRQDPEARHGARFAESWWLVGARGRHPLGRGEAPEVEDAVEAPLLVIDDLGSEQDDGRGVMQFVIFKRHNAELPTWITTGFNPEQLMARYGNQVIRRLVEHGKRVQLGGKP
jgi:hypothetical protein